MALICCPDCQYDISDAAPACIYCGRPRDVPAATGPVSEEGDREERPIFGALERSVCPSCAATIDEPAAWEGGDADCANCGARFRFVDSRPPLPTGFNPGIAAVMSLVIPGSGQMYRGKVGIGIAWLAGTVACYVAGIVLGAVVHVVCVFNAASRNA